MRSDELVEQLETSAGTGEAALASFNDALCSCGI